MSAALNFDASKVVPSTGAQDPIPAGWYNAAIDESEMKPTKDTTGAFLQLRFNILDGAHVGKKVYARLNLKNLNPVAVEIAYKELSAIAHAVGVIQVADSAQLHGLPMKIKVKLRAAQGDYEANNEVTAYKNINDQSMVTAAGPGTIAPTFAMPGAPAGVVTPPPLTAAAQPWAQPAAPAVPPVVAAPVAFVPPPGWVAHPTAPGYYYMGQEVLTEAQLRAKVAAPAVPAAPPVVPSVPGVTSAAQTAQPPWATMPAA